MRQATEKMEKSIICGEHKNLLEPDAFSLIRLEQKKDVFEIKYSKVSSLCLISL